MKKDNKFIINLENSSAYFKKGCVDIMSKTQEEIINELEETVRNLNKLLIELDSSVRISINTVSKDVQLSKLLKKLGIPVNLNGYNYIRYALLICCENPSIMVNITKTLYPAIAKKFNINYNQAERSIRYAIHYSWNNTSHDFIEKVFGFTIAHEKCPSNSKYLSTILDYIKLNS